MQEMVIYGVSFDMVGKQPIVLLKAVDTNKFLPIWIGHPEAAAILMKLQGASTPRPMTHDLLFDMLGELEVALHPRLGHRAAREHLLRLDHAVDQRRARSRSTRGRATRWRSPSAPARRSSPPRTSSPSPRSSSSTRSRTPRRSWTGSRSSSTRSRPRTSGAAKSSSRLGAQAGARARARGRARARSARRSRCRRPRRPAGAATSRSARGSRWPRAPASSPVGVLEHQVDAREAVAAEQPVDGDRQLLRADASSRRPAPQGTGNRCGRSRSAPRSRRSPPRAGSPRRAGAPRAVRALDHRHREVAARRRGARAAPWCRRRRRRRARRARRRPRRANLMPSAEPWPAGLTTIGKSSRASMAGSALAAPSSRNAVSRERVEVGRRDAGVAHRVLGEHLVHAADAGRRAGAGVGEAEELEQLLHRAVLAVAAVQRDEGDVRARPPRAASTRSGPTSMPATSWPSRSSASCDLGAGAQRDLRSSERPPLRTATRLTAPAGAAGARCGSAGSADRRGRPGAPGAGSAPVSVP